MSRSFYKAERLNNILINLATSTNGITRSELSKRLGVSKATLSRDIRELSTEYPVTEDEVTGKLKIDRLSITNYLRLNAGEIQALHLACRLLGRKVRFRFPAAASALRKLGAAIEYYKNPLAGFIIKTAELFELHGAENTKVYEENISKITGAVVLGRIIEFERFSRGSGKWRKGSLCPYCVEPYAEGNSLYLIGKDEESNELRTYKLELIRSITLTDREYKIPDDFSMNDYFRDCWGIWTSKNPPEKVVIIFSEGVRDRVLQTEWHITGRKRALPDGRLEWSARIAELHEMLPWIRGWGADAEVIEPLWLRGLIAGDAIKTAGLYGETGVK